MTKELFLSQLEKHIEGMLFPSESEFPFETIVWENFARDIVNTEKWLSYLQLPVDSFIENTTVEYLFRNLSTTQEWHDEFQRSQVEKFRKLQQVLAEHLKNLTVYRVGKINVLVLIIGTLNNDVIGLKTEAVET